MSVTNGQVLEWMQYALCNSGMALGFCGYPDGHEHRSSIAYAMGLLAESTFDQLSREKRDEPSALEALPATIKEFEDWWSSVDYYASVPEAGRSLLEVLASGPPDVLAAETKVLQLLLVAHVAEKASVPDGVTASVYEAIDDAHRELSEAA